MAFIFWKIWQERIWLGWGRKKLWWNCPDIISPPIQGQPGQFRSCADFCVPAKQNYPIDRHSSFIHCSMEMPAYKKGQTNLGCSLCTIMSIHDHVIKCLVAPWNFTRYISFVKQGFPNELKPLVCKLQVPWIADIFSKYPTEFSCKSNDERTGYFEAYRHSR